MVEGDLAAVTSSVDPGCLQALDRTTAIGYLSAHQRVIETVLRDYPVLPVKFGLTLPDEGALRGLLRQGHHLLQTTLAAYAGQQQREVLVLWDLQKTFQEIAAEGPIAALRAQIIGRPDEETTAERIALGQQVHAELQRRRDAISAQVIARLGVVAADLIIQPTMNDSMVANVALLIDDARQGDLDEALDELDAHFASQLQIRCVGPLPAYSFATLEVRALPFVAVDAARRQLGLAEELRSGEIKQAYRQLAARVHPDLNPSADASAEMEALSAAYQLLSAVAKAQADAEESADWPCHLDRESVERTLLLNLARQAGVNEA